MTVRRVLVTGGAGFIGSAVCRRLIGLGHHVLNVDALTYAGNLASLGAVADDPSYRFVKADIRDAEAIGRSFADYRPDSVIHLAAETHVDRSIGTPRGFIETNIVGAFTMLEASRDWWSCLPEADRGRFRFVHVSTDEVYGSLGPAGAFSETTRYDPSSPYSASKAAADHLVSAWARTYGLPTLVSNCSNNYGPFHFPEKLIPLTILNALHGRPLPVYGTGANVRDWLHVDDHADALIAILQRGEPGQSYMVGGRSERSNMGVVKAICAILDRLKPEGAPHGRHISFVKDRPGHDLRYAVDPTKLETGLGWKARRSFETGLEQTVQWYIDNEWWWRPLREKVYAGERLGVIDAQGSRTQA